MRLFVAIPLSDEVRHAVAEAQRRLQAVTAEVGAEVRWSDADEFHLTVKFIGDLPDSRLEAVQTICEQISSARAFPFSARGVSVFPKRGAVKTIWVGIHTGAEQWKALVQSGEDSFAALGVAREGGLVPHITLGRVRDAPEGDGLRQAIGAFGNADCGTQIADRIVLMQSFLNPDGAVHQQIGSWSLQHK